MAVVFWGLSPHPPVLIREVRSSSFDEKMANTIKAEETWAAKLAASRPGRIVIMSPHAPSFAPAMPIFAVPRLSGSMKHFGRPDVKMSLDIDIDFTRRIIAACEDEQFPLLVLDEDVSSRCHVEADIDHGVFVPMRFAEEAGLHVPVVVIGYSGASVDDYRCLGRIIRNLADDDDVPTAIIASGDLSHRLLESGPYGFHPMGPKFDEHIAEVLQARDFELIGLIDHEEIKESAQCGLNAIAMLLGSMEGAETVTHLLSCEGPLGVGYAVCMYLPVSAGTGESAGAEETADAGGDDAVKDSCNIYRSCNNNECEDDKEDHQAGKPGTEKCAKSAESAGERDDVRIRLARRSVEHFVRTGNILKVAEDEYSELAEPAAVFVTLKENGELRGCIGTMRPVRDSQKYEIIHNAVSACSRDPRFVPVGEEELSELHYQVYVLSAPVPVKGPQDLDPKRYGVLVVKGERTGVLLPDLEGVDTVEVQLGIACRKGGIMLDEKPDLYRFTADVYEEAE